MRDTDEESAAAALPTSLDQNEPIEDPSLSQKPQLLRPLL